MNFMYFNCLFFLQFVCKINKYDIGIGKKTRQRIEKTDICLNFVCQ